MNRKRNDWEYNDHKDNELGPMTKKIKSPLPAVDKLSLQHKNDESMFLDEKQSIYGKNMDTVGQNGLMKLAIISNLPPQVFEMKRMCNLINFLFLYMRIVVIRSMP